MKEHNDQKLNVKVSPTCNPAEPLVQGLPEFLVPAYKNSKKAELIKVPSPLPNWLTANTDDSVKPSKEGKNLLIEYYKNMTPRVLELICSGSTLTAALEEHFRDVDPGAYMRWLKRDKRFYDLYIEAKEVRTETWTGKMVKHAEGAETMEEVQRSKLIVDTYKWLVECDDRSTYGRRQDININSRVSILDALEQANKRVIDVDYKEVD